MGILDAPIQTRAALDAKYAQVAKSQQNALTGWWHADGFGAKNDDTTDSRTAIDNAITACSAAGGGTVYLPPGKYVVSGALTPRSGVTVLGQNLAASIRSSVNGNVFYARSVAFKDFALDGILFTGTVNSFPTVPTRARTTSGPGTVSAVGMSGDTDPDSPGGARLENFTMRNCAVRNCSGLPILIKGVRGVNRIQNNEFTYNMDVGFVAYEELIFTGNHVYGSADNGVSASRGGKKITITGNTFENCAYNGVFMAGFLTDKGPQNFSVSNNVVKDVGNSGIYVDAASKYGTISGNELDGGYFRGTSDGPTDGAVCGIFLGGYPTDNRATPTDWAEGVAVTGNHIRRFPRAGVFGTGIKRSIIMGNQITDIGSQFLADGTTTIAAADATTNVGILIDQATTSSDVVIAINHIVDGRATPYMNWGIYPVGSSVANEYFNSMVGARNAYNLIETGPTRNINWGAVFQTNSKFTGGTTVGSNAGSGLIAGYDTNGAAGSNRPNRWLTAGVERWRAGADNTTEAGSNVGTDWVLSSYDDAGAALATILRVTRKGATTLGVQGQPVTVNAKVVSGASSVTGITAGAQATAASAGGNGANDLAGTLNATAVASPAAGTLVTVTFGTAFATTPHVVLTAQNAASASCQPYVTRSSTGFTIACATAPGASASLSFDYHVIG